MSIKQRLVRIGNASGYWGDDPSALSRLLAGPARLDYVTLDFLAEVTMSILSKQRTRDPLKGYAADFVEQVSPLLKRLVSDGTVVITNAGGLNPLSCAHELCVRARAQGLSLRVAVVSGDDVLARMQAYAEPAGEEFRNMDTAELIPVIQKSLITANAYLGARCVAEALAWQPHVVVTGRVIDAGLTLGPLIHEFGWKPDAWHQLASGICAGHLIECGAQVCGGNFSDFGEVKSFENIGFPIVECAEDGSFVVTKQLGTGGLINEFTVKEQLLYEVGDPSAYVVPDVVANFASAQVQSVAEDRVRVSGVQGAPAPHHYKVSACYHAGYRFSHGILLSGPRLRDKLALLEGIAREKYAAVCSERGVSMARDLLIEAVGDSAVDPDELQRIEPSEVIFRISANSESRAALEALRKMVPGLILIGPPGMAVLGGNPQVSELLGFWPCLIRKELVKPYLTLIEDGKQTQTRCITEDTGCEIAMPHNDPVAAQKSPLATRQTQPRPLYERALARSGDKGDKANIAIIARTPDDFAYLRDHLTTDCLRSLLPTYCTGSITRFEAPQLQALNFLLEAALPGGGTRNLRIDPQGKTLAQTLLKRWV